MSDPTGGVPDPERNRQEYLAAHPEAQQATPGQAADQVAAQLGADAPQPGVSGDQLGAQMRAAGTSAGLPHEDAMNALMDQIRALSEQVQDMRFHEYQRDQATIMALGEPLLQRYANGVRDKLAAHADANPGAGAEHFKPIIAHATNLASAAAEAIASGGNDLAKVNYLASILDRFFDRGHHRTAPGHIKHLDLGSAAYDLEQVITEASRLAQSGGIPPAPPAQVSLMASAPAS